jgi:cob(I)alamin adenosyltransferase
MKVYTKHGDKGMTSLASGMQIFKSDERVEAMGDLDELTSQIGLAKVLVRDGSLRAGLQRVQKALITVMASVADGRTQKNVLPEEEIAFLEEEIDRMDDTMPQQTAFVLPGGNEASARMDVARTVARRAERALVVVARKFSVQEPVKAYINRLSGYLYTAARWLEANENNAAPAVSAPAVVPQPAVAAAIPTAVKAAVPAPTGGSAVMDQSNDIVKEVLRQLGGYRPLDLARAKRLIEAVEAEADRQGKKAVIAVCNAEGNPVAVHVMDGAFLVSYEVAVKKAYTSVAVKMPTMELAKLAQPGQTFYGLANLEKMVIFGGGVPLMENGRIIGGLGISGGTGEEDHALCEYALGIFDNI